MFLKFQCSYPQFIINTNELLNNIAKIYTNTYSKLIVIEVLADCVTQIKGLLFPLPCTVITYVGPE